MKTSEFDKLIHRRQNIFVTRSLGKIISCDYFMTISLKALTFSAHGEGGNSIGIDGRGKLAYNELFLTHIVTTCSIRQHAQSD